MNKEKELLLKLLMEKYGEGDLDYYRVESRLGRGYSSYGGAKYEIVEPEVWEEFDLGNIGPYEPINNMIHATFYTAQTKCARVRVSSYNNMEFSFKGGDPKLIAKALWMTKPLGFGLKGDLTVMIKDGFDQERIVSFNYEYA